ncbi:histidine kinase [Frankia sp. R43]|uniref:hybrid sensor histidine kinase/response regulator n=1 Tax=Frankia sp. R43 TaxID=269536 RepID=UPI0006C9E983|nr:ATP-binding protein [Frankia sp. R43]KPM52736.1 histidine kinase [Frankia sp. R43]
MSGSATSILANAATTAAYLAICLSIARGLWRSGQWRNNPLGLATAAIFFTCAIGHGSHIFHNPHADGHPTHSASDGSGAAFDPSLIDVQFLTTGWDVLTATVGIWYWTLRGRFPALVRGTALFEDLRIREATQRTLRESEERYREIVETTTDGVVLLDSHGAITYCNPQFAALVGQIRPGTPFVTLVSDLDWDEIQCALEVVRSGTPRRLEVGLRHPDARKVCAQVALTARIGPTGALDGTLAIVTDITEQKNIEAQLRQAQRLDALGQLAGGIAHDFNNLLTVIDGYATLILARTDLDEGVLRDLAAVREASGRAAGLTSQLLAFSRTSDVRPGPVDLNDLVRGLEGMLRRLIREDIELMVMPAHRAAVVRIDRGKLEQVLVNLVVNSRDAMPEGGRLFIRVDIADDTAPELGFSVLRGALARPFVRLTVADTGHGMTDDVRARIFEPFYTTKALGRGTGLGLATVYGIVRQAEGNVEVDSVPGLGATFRVDLPALADSGPTGSGPGRPTVAAGATESARLAGSAGSAGAAGSPGTAGCADAPAPLADDRPTAAGSRRYADDHHGAGGSSPPAVPVAGFAGQDCWPRREGGWPARGSATILLAEDDDAVRNLAERVLRAAGYLVVSAADGRTAIDLARGLTSIDLLLTDVILPGRNGRQLAEELIRMFPGLPVVFTSAYSRGMLAEGGTTLDYAYLPKPFTPTALTEAIRDALGARWPGLPDGAEFPGIPGIPGGPGSLGGPGAPGSPGGHGRAGATGLPAARTPSARLSGTSAGRHRERRLRRGP